MSLTGLLRRIHDLRLEFAEWLVLLVGGVLLSAINGHNLLQFVLSGRFYITRLRGSYLAYWSEDATVIGLDALFSASVFLGANAAILTALIYPILVWRWGKAVPGYARKPPLSLGDD